MAARGVERTADGAGIRVRLSERERELLASLPVQLRAVLRGEAGPTGLRARLLPPAYDDPLQELEYREVTGSSVEDERLAAVDAFAETLEGGTVGRRGWSAVLTVEEADAWLSAVNDARLTLAAVVGVDTEDDWDRVRADPDAQAIALDYLSWLQMELLYALMGRLDEAEDR